MGVILDIQSKSNITYISLGHQDNFNHFSELYYTIASSIKLGNKNFIVDLTNLQILYQKDVTAIQCIDNLVKFNYGTVSFIVTETRPTMNYSVGSSISKLKFYLSQTEAVNEI